MSTTQTDFIPESPGETLKQLREKRGLSIEEIARRMHLEPGMIRALETNDYNRLPAAIYVRGYLRNYAKIVGADADQIIALYDHDAPEPPEIIPEVKHSPQVSSSDKPVRAFTYLITFIMVLLLLIWLQNNFLTPDIEIVATEEPGPGQTVIPESEPDYDTYPETVTELPPEPLPLYPDETEATEEIPPADTADNASGQSGLLTLDTDSDIEALEPQENVGPDTLLLHITADSWIEVYDKFSNKLYLGLARTGEEIFIRGHAPLDVKLGFSQGVTVEFNGEPYDPAPHSRSGVATFVLGE